MTVEWEKCADCGNDFKSDDGWTYPPEIERRDDFGNDWLCKHCYAGRRIERLEEAVFKS